MRNLAHEAGFMALDEVKEGRTVLVLFPTNTWGAVMFDMGPAPKGVFMSTCESEDPYPEVDTVITVDDAACEQEAVARAGGTKVLRVTRECM